MLKQLYLLWPDGPLGAEGPSVWDKSHLIAGKRYSIIGLGVSQLAAWLHRGGFHCSLKRRQRMRAVQRGAGERDRVMHMEVAPLKTATLLAGRFIQTLAHRFSSSCLYLLLRGNPSSPPTTTNPLKVSLIIPMDTAIWSAGNLPLMCFTVPLRQYWIWFNRSELNPRVKWWGVAAIHEHFRRLKDVAEAATRRWTSGLNVNLYHCFFVF